MRFAHVMTAGADDPRLVLVDDDRAMCTFLDGSLSRRGFETGQEDLRGDAEAQGWQVLDLRIAEGARVLVGE